MQTFNSTAKIIAGSVFAVAGMFIGIIVRFHPMEVIVLMTLLFMIGISVGPNIFYVFANAQNRIFLVTGPVGLSFVKLSIKVFSSDNNISETDILKLKKYIIQEFGEEIGTAADEFARIYKSKKVSIAQICAPINEMSYSNRIGFVTQMFSMLTHRGTYSDSEEEYIRKIAYCLHIGKKRYEMIQSVFINKSSTYQEFINNQEQNHNQQKQEQFTNRFFNPFYNPYFILGIESNLSIDEIKQAYRKLAKKYHPDVLNGKSDSIKKQFKEKFIEINEAYEKIKKMRGFK